MCACWSIRWTWSTFEQLKKSFVLRKFVCFEVAYFYLSCQPNELCIVIMILWNYCTVIRILFYASHWPYVVIIKIRQFLFVVCCSDTTSAQRSHLPFEIVQRPKPSCLHLQANQRLLHLVHKHRRLASTFCGRHLPSRCFMATFNCCRCSQTQNSGVPIQGTSRYPKSFKRALFAHLFGLVILRRHASG